MNNACSETGTDLSLDFHKELKNNQNSSSNFLSFKDIQNNKNTKSDENQTLKYEENKFNSSGVGTPNFFGKDENSETLENIQNRIPINNFNVNIKNYRLDNFKHLRNKFEKISVSTKNTKSFDFDKIFKNTNKEKNTNVINQINSLLTNIDNIKTKSTTFSPEVKDSLLNSYKNFIVVKENKKFNEGVPILELKKEAFLKNTQLQDIKEVLERSYHKRSNSLDKQIFLEKDEDNLKEADFIKKLRKYENISTKNYNNNYLLNLNNQNDKYNFFSTELLTKKLTKTKPISTKKKKYFIKLYKFLNKHFSFKIKIDMDINKIFEDEKKEKDPIQNLNDDKVLRKKFILPKINHKEVNIELLPEKVDIYSKIKIQDLIGLSQLVKPKFKYK